MAEGGAAIGHGPHGPGLASPVTTEVRECQQVLWALVARELKKEVSGAEGQSPGCPNIYRYTSVSVYVDGTV